MAQAVALGNHFRTFGTQSKKPHPSRSCRLQNTFFGGIEDWERVK